MSFIVVISPKKSTHTNKTKFLKYFEKKIVPKNYAKKPPSVPRPGPSPNTKYKIPNLY
jgi:hypothetical protein